MKYWEIIADNLKKRGWSLGYVSAPTEWQRIGDEIDAAFIFAGSHFVKVDAHKQVRHPPKGIGLRSHMGIRRENCQTSK
jgi:hypothetical protein